MPVVMSAGQLAEIRRPWWPTNSYGSLRFYNDYAYDYAAIYRMQPNVRTCVDFLARNIAQLGLHVFRRVSDTDRERLRDHPLAQIIGRPLPPQYKVTRYRLIEALVADLGIYFNAYWLKIRTEDRLGLLRLPPPYVHVEGSLVPQRYEIRLSGNTIPVDPADIVHYRGYNPESEFVGLSPLETLRRILAEEHAAGDYREHFWKNSARMNGIIKRPATAPQWSRAARERFKAEFEALYAGAENSGKTAILEEDMEWVPNVFNAQESEYLAGRKLTREECARAYHIPLPMVGILDHATFSNIKEQHKNLYQDSLGPWLRLIEEDIQLQLLPEFEDTDGVYCEFNIQEKLAGSFEEQVKALQSAVGRPWMTVNEARARQNLPGKDDGDVLVTPLNVLIGGQASPRDSAPDDGDKGRFSKTAPYRASETPEDGGSERLKAGGDGGLSLKSLDLHNQDIRARHERKWREVLVRHYRRQEAAIVSRVPEAAARASAAGKSDIGGVWYDDDRWTNELYDDLLPLNTLTATTWAEMATGALEAEVDEDAMEQRMGPWLREHTRVSSELLNAYTREELAAAIRDPEPRDAVKGVFEQAVAVWAVRQAQSFVTTAQNFGATEGAAASGLRSKTWQVNSSNPRPDHAALNGVTVGIRERFPNGLRWPGDPAGTAEQNANCMCSVRFS
jgi:HK97 family phage portal protein